MVFPLFQASVTGIPGLVPYRDTNIPWDLGCFFRGAILRSVPWVSPSTLQGYQHPLGFVLMFRGAILCSVPWVSPSTLPGYQHPLGFVLMFRGAILRSVPWVSPSTLPGY